MTEAMPDGMIHTMVVTKEPTIDMAGRVVVPKALRERAGLTAGTRLRIWCEDGIIHVAPAPRVVSIVCEDDLPVANPVEASRPLSTEVVRDTLEEIRSERQGL